jgi:hypothetical protein
MVLELARNPSRKLTRPVLHPAPANPKNPAVQPAQAGPLLPKSDQVSDHDTLAAMVRSLTRRTRIMELEAAVLNAPGMTREVEKTALPLTLADPAPDIIPRRALNEPVIEEEMMTEGATLPLTLPLTLRDPLRDPQVEDPVHNPVLSAAQALPVDPLALLGNAPAIQVDEGILNWENNSATCSAQWEGLQASPSRPRSRRTEINPNRIY